MVLLCMVFTSPLELLETDNVFQIPIGQFADSLSHNNCPWFCTHSHLFGYFQHFDLDKVHNILGTRHIQKERALFSRLLNVNVTKRGFHGKKRFVLRYIHVHYILRYIALHSSCTTQVRMYKNPLRCDPDLCWLKHEAWTTRFKVTMDETPCRAPLGLAAIPWEWLNRGHMGCETGMYKISVKQEGIPVGCIPPACPTAHV